MPLLLDTYNILHHPSALPTHLAGLELDLLLELLHRSRYRRRRTTLVCDGVRPRAASSPRRGSIIEIRYAGPGRSADELIVQLIGRSTAPRRLLVVTSDRAIVREARRRRCATMGAAPFLAELADDYERHAGRRARPQRPAGPLSPAQVREWIRIFGLDRHPAEGSASEVVQTPRRPQARKHARRDMRAKRPSAPGLPRDVIDQAERLLEEDDLSTGPPG
ncbi:MAG: NYN domain-containing protein [Planctomycetota bacterium]|jgi:predicted RNA-binding protein with PIN domain